MAKLGFVPISGYTCTAENAGVYKCPRHEQETITMRRGETYPLCGIENRIVQWIRVNDPNDEGASI